MPTINDVAKHVGLSPTTVSHALSGKHPVAAATRARILAVAEELGYHPNSSASSLRAGRTRTIGLSVLLDMPGRSLSHGPFSEYIEHIADHLNEHGHKLLTLVTHSPEPADLVRLARSGQVDGVILLQIRLDDPRINDLRHTSLPCVCIGRPAMTNGLICVDADLVAAGELAAQHLFALGHTRVGFLGKTPTMGYQYHALAGYRRAHDTAGMPIRSDQLIEVNSAVGLRGALVPFLETSDPLTALITTTDIEAVTAMNVLTSQGLRVPGDVSIITLGDSVLTELAQPAITAIRFSVRDECILAVDLLLGMLGNQPPTQHMHILPVQLIDRYSTGPAGPARRHERHTTLVPETGTVAGQQEVVGQMLDTTDMRRKEVVS